MLALLLTVTAVTKALDLDGMAGIVDTYRVLPPVLAFQAATAVMLAELAIGGLLLLGCWPVFACLVSAGLHAVYFLWSVVALARDLEIANCGCFGVFWPRPLSVTTLAEDAFLIALSLLLAQHYLGCRA